MPDRPPSRAGPQRLPPPLRRDCALFLDIDGTLLELAARPERVEVDPGIARMLPVLAADLDGAVALITGRTIADADRLFPGLRLPVAGLHGLERRAHEGAVHIHWASTPALRQLRGELLRLAGRHAGVVLEDKGGTLALHYRAAPRLAAYLHRFVRARVAAIAADRRWTLQPGRRVVEVRPDGRDKGTAVTEFLDEPPFRGRLPVFVGDDHTDEQGFAAVTRSGGFAVKVGPGATRARYRLPDVAGVRRWLRRSMDAWTTTEQEAE
jgi:trehalose 6-phosphate phosphatase